MISQILSDQRSNVKLVTIKLGAETANMATECNPNLILLDLNLPDMNGINVMKELKSNPKTKNIPVVIQCAAAMPFQQENLIELGASYFLTNPLKVGSFLKIVDEFLLN